MGNKHNFYTDCNALEQEVLSRFRTVLYNCWQTCPPKTTDDLDIISYRLLDVLQKEVSLNLYKEIIKPMVKKQVKV
jgi:hypothetical protein